MFFLIVWYSTPRKIELLHDCPRDGHPPNDSRILTPKITFRPSIMNQSPYHNTSCKRPRSTKCDTIHKTQQST